MIAAGDSSIPKTASSRTLLGITAAVRASAAAPRLLQPVHVVGVAVKFLQGIDHFIKFDHTTGSGDLP